MSSILNFRGLYFCAAYLPANNLRRISTIYLRGYWKGSENGRVVTIDKYASLYKIDKINNDYNNSQVPHRSHITKIRSKGRHLKHNH
jgi:hypothetical protein